MPRFELVDQIVREPVVDHHRAEHRGLGLDVAGKLLRLGHGGNGECESCHPLHLRDAWVLVQAARAGMLGISDRANARRYRTGMADPRIIDVQLDETSLGWRSPDVEQERRIAIFDLIEGNHFAPQRAYADGYAGPYKIKLQSEEGRLGIHIHREDDTHLETLVLALGRFRRPIRDYFVICDSYYQAIRQSSPAQIETVDMARRGVHNEAAELLKERLDGKIEVDFDTARRLFTLICVLHIRN
jgi:uncharacterized protein (UPF0262 family)